MGMVFEGGPDDIGQHSVMLALADNADEAGLAFPGIPLIARKSRHSERNVTRVLAELEAGGWLTIRRRVRGIRRRCSEYSLNLARLKSVAETRAEESLREEDEHEGKTAAISRTDTVSGGGRKRAAKKDTSEPRTDTVSGGADERPNPVDERPKASSRTDMTLADVVLNQGDDSHNRHRTIIEPPTTPQPPASGGLRPILDTSRESQNERLSSDGDVEAAELAEANAIRGRMTPPLCPLTWAEYAIGRHATIVRGAQRPGGRRPRGERRRESYRAVAAYPQ
jgi:hypothetical protein